MGACAAPQGSGSARDSSSGAADDEDESKDPEQTSKASGNDDDDTPSSSTSTSDVPVSESSSTAASTTGSSDDGSTTPGATTGGFESTTSATTTSGDAEDSGGPVVSCEGGQTQPGFHVRDGKLYDNHCQEFIMRGVNYAYTWANEAPPEQSIADIASLGANAIRVVLATGGRWARDGGDEVTNVISWAKANRLVAMLEVHDSTGWAEQADSVHPDDAVAYWLSDDIRGAIDGQEAFVLINIANEAFGNDTTDQWAEFYVRAIPELRAAGVKHTLVVDAPNWGQDWQNVMRDGDGATAIFEADPDRNVVFSVHMYNVYKTAAEVDPYFDNFLQKGLPLVVGEFAADHGPGDDNVVDEDAIMRNAVEHGVGYLGWSWSGNSSGLESLDITMGFDVNQLSPWGQRLIHGENGIAATAKPCTCFE